MSLKNFSLTFSLPTSFGPLTIHWTCFLFWALTATEGLAHFLLVPSLFLLVILHEFGHCYVAKKHGLVLDGISLFPFGGCARIGMTQLSPITELAVTAAGPLVNVLLVLPTLALAALCKNIPTLNVLTSNIVFINIAMVIFNLIPAFPMDGGRLFRACLHLWMDEYKATYIAVRLSQAISIIGGIFALSKGHFMLVLIAFFISIAATIELNLVEQRLKTDEVAEQNLALSALDEQDLF